MVSRVLSRLDDMLAAMDVVDEIAARKREKALSRIEMLTLERALEILSEAGRHIPDTMKDDHAEIPWRQIAGLGNIMRHDYRRPDPDIVIDIATKHAPVLRPVLRDMIEHLESEDRASDL